MVARRRIRVSIQTVRLFVKNVPDFTTDRSKNDLGFLSWDLKVSREGVNLTVDGRLFHSFGPTCEKPRFPYLLWKFRLYSFMRG